MGIIDIIFGIDEKKAFEARRNEILSFKSEVINLIDSLIPQQKTEMSKERLMMMRNAVEKAVIKGYPSAVLATGKGVSVLGTNQKLIAFNPETKKPKIIGPNIISLPQYHLFHKNKLTERGRITLLHELAHTVTPSEFRADITAARMGARLGISKAAIVRSIVGRRAIIGKKRAEALMERIKAMKERKPPRRLALRPA